MPAGVFNVVHGDGPTTGAALVAHPHVPKLTFTGSTVTGQAILRSAADHIKSVHLELGGKTPSIVFGDADLDQAISGSLFTAFYNTGPDLHERLAPARPAQRAPTRSSRRSWSGPRASRSAIRPTARSQLGPLISEEQYQRVTGYIEEGRRGGARLALGGGRPSVPVADDGYYVEPTIFVDVTPDMRIAKEEIFGPVLSVLTFEDEDEAHPDRQRRHVRPGGDGLDDRSRARLPGRRQDRRRDHLDELPALPAGQRAVRGPQDVGPRRGPRRRGAPDRSPTSRPIASTSTAGRWRGRESRGDGRSCRPRRDPRPVPPGSRASPTSTRATYGLPPQATVDALDRAHAACGRRERATG